MSVVRRLKTIFTRGRVLRALLAAGFIWFMIALLLAAVIHIFGQADYAQAADVLVVLGAGLRPDNTPTAAMISRAEHAAALWGRGIAPVIICAGGYAGRATRSEAAVCADILVENGVPRAVIILEEKSRSTEENALECEIIMAANGWHSAVLVSSDFHLFRARWLFESQGIVSTTSPSPPHLNPTEYAVALVREVAALNFLVIKRALGLNITYIQSF